MSGDYYYEFDDPYKLLAYNIIGDYRPSDVVRLLTDDKYVLSLIAKETRLQDFCGPFTDCIIEDILAHKRRMEFMGKLDVLSSYLFSRLDIQRLRKEVKTALNECGIDLGDLSYASAGNVSAANT